MALNSVIKTHQKRKTPEHQKAHHAAQRSKGSHVARSGRKLLVPVARAMQHLLRLPADNPRLAQLAACAQLVACQGRGSSGDAWSSPEMEAARSEAGRLESAWQRFSGGGTALFDAEAAAGSAALCLVLREMEAAVREGRPVPEHSELLTRVAHTLLGHRFSGTEDLEQAVNRMLSPAGDFGQGLPHSAELAAGVLAGWPEAAESPASCGRAAAHVASFLSQY